MMNMAKVLKYNEFELNVGCLRFCIYPLYKEVLGELIFALRGTLNNNVQYHLNPPALILLLTRYAVKPRNPE